MLNLAAKDTLAYWALAAFARLRASELERLEWSDVNHDHILVRARNSKTKTRRGVDIQGNLLRWLETCRDGAGKVAPLNLRTKLLADRERVGRFIVRADEKLTGFLELESTIRAQNAQGELRRA